MNTQPADNHAPSLAELEHQLIHHTELPRTTLSNGLDAVVDRIGATTSWLWIATVGVILYSVVSRYLFGQGSVMLEEVAWHLAGAAWLIGLSYTLVHDDHVRVDVLHERLSLKAQAWIELLGILLLLLPFLVLALGEVTPYAYSSYELNEHSQAPNGLPWRWILKSFIPLSLALLLIAALSRALRTTSLLLGWPKALPRKPSNGEG
ncbi:MAG: TRAP transporter small permease subunit [Gammaproteobacteria bacterium]